MSKKTRITRRIRTAPEAVVRTRADWPAMLAQIGATPQTHAINIYVRRGKANLGALPHKVLNNLFTHDGVCRVKGLEEPVAPGRVRVHVLGTSNDQPFIFDCAVSL